MGCVCSKGRKLKPTMEVEPPEDSCYFSGIQRNAREGYDSCELRPMVPKSTTTKTPEIGSMLGRASIASLKKAVEVLDTLGSSMSSLNANGGFISGVSIRGNKISILAFEVANTIAKGANLLRSLSEEHIQFLKKDVIHSDSVLKLVSTDTNELLQIAATDKRDELGIFSAEVVRFGNLCRDPVWHNLDRYFQKLDADIVIEDHEKEVEETVQVLIILAQNTSELYHELHTLDRFEHDCRMKLQEEETLPAGRKESLMILNSELRQQRKHVKSLKKRSLWSRGLEEVVEKLVDIVIFLHKRIIVSFGIPGTNTVDDWASNYQRLGSILVEHKQVNNQRLGVCGLALHYANVINQIDNIVARPVALPPNTRDTLYQGLPTGVKAALRLQLQSDAKEEYSVARIKAEMQKTLDWILPIAENTIRAHQGFGWVGEWANVGSEVNKKGGPQHTITRLQTLYHADRQKTDKHILELVVWLHHLVSQVKAKGFGLASLKPIGNRPQKGAVSVERTRGHPSSVLSMHKLSQEELEMVENMSLARTVFRRSKSLDFARTEERDAWRGLSRSCDNSPSRGFGKAVVLPLERTKVLDVLDGLDRLGTFAKVPL